MNINDESILLFRKELRILEREIDLELKSETLCCGVTLAQCHLILEISERERASLKELSETLGLDKSTLSRTVDGMVESGLLLRIADSNDRRLIQLSLSEKGLDKAKSVNALCNDYYREFLSYIPEDKVSNIIETVSLLSKGMELMRRNKRKNTCCRIKKKP